MLVGKDEVEFYIHPSVLERSSEFFKVALKSYWTEGQENEISMPDDDPDLFKTYAAWLYSGRLAEPMSQRTGYQELLEL